MRTVTLGLVVAIGSVGILIAQMILGSFFSVIAARLFGGSFR